MIAELKSLQLDSKDRAEVARKLRELADFLEWPTGAIMDVSVSLPERVAENMVEYTIKFRQFEVE